MADINRVMKSSGPPEDSMSPEQRCKMREQIDAKMNSLITQLYIYLANRLSTSCCGLCEKMQERLPRELRDLVYEYILEDRVLKVDPKVMTELKQYENEIELRHKRRFYFPGHQSPKIYHVADTRFTGTATAQELSYSYYRNMTFCFDGDSTQVGQRLANFLYNTINPWLSFSNMSHVIQKVELRTTDGRMEDGLWTLRELGPFKWMTRKIHINIEVERRRYRRIEEIPRLVEVIGKVLPLLQELEWKGHTILLTIQDCIPQSFCSKRQSWIRNEAQPQVRLNGESLKLHILAQMLGAVE
jgi:hypothetical protein